MRAYGHDFKLNFFTDTARNDEFLPLAIVIHGGGFNSGSKDNCKIIESAREFASRGYRTIAINYPLCGAYWNGTDVNEDVAPFGSGPWHAWDAEEPLYPLGVGQQHPQCKKGAASRQAHPEQYMQAQEVANRAARYAIQYAHSRAEEWGIDVERTVCNGASAGAVTCYEMFLFNTTVSFRPESTGLEPVLELDQIKINVAAGRAGGLSTPPEVRAVTDETVAVMAPGAAIYDLHGDEDVTVPITSAEFLVETLDEFGIPAELDIAAGEGHSLFPWQFNKSHPERLNAMFDFIETYLPDNGGDDDDDDVDNDGFWNYTDVQYGTEDPSMQLMNIALPSSGEYGVVMFHHPKGSTYNDIGQREVNAALDSGYALVSWESFGAYEAVDLEAAWRYAQTCFEFLRSSSDQYGWKSENIIIAGRSMGSIVSWKLAHSQEPAIVGIHFYNALPRQTWQAPDLWYPPDDVVSPAYGPGPNSDYGHNPVYAYPVRDKYMELGEEDKLTFIEGMWDDPALHNGGWINTYATFHYFPDLVAQIEAVSSSPSMVPTATTSSEPSITVSSSPSMVPTATNSSETGFCFPSESIVQVIRMEGDKKNKMVIPTEQLQIDDFVLTVGTKLSPSYERVYSFGHYDPNLPRVEYLRFLPSGLELSPNHYVYRSGKFVPAREIEVGDDLLLMKTTRKQEKVSGIKHVYRRGALAPLTASGTIVVDGVLASRYASFWDDDESSLLPSWIENQFHEWAHFVIIILRCSSWVFGKQEQHNIGLSTSTDHLRKMTVW
eukprot:CAMPEP_0194207418 /NCGR_PEP_ID=MMETSP0156-20130528/6169_1 /TAXON_ID=33649 /ORGANISM="Thalassionema nitzschioides, Strain L26-B" /LENGTH=774 /DNA_ID=CAMNT_0038934179 /DNA_START=650 /DNA_END=2971 /DNA_ORIENTATION=+